MAELNARHHADVRPMCGDAPPGTDVVLGFAEGPASAFKGLKGRGAQGREVTVRPPRGRVVTITGGDVDIDRTAAFLLLSRLNFERANVYVAGEGCGASRCVSRRAPDVAFSLADGSLGGILRCLVELAECWGIRDSGDPDSPMIGAVISRNHLRGNPRGRRRNGTEAVQLGTTKAHTKTRLGAKFDRNLIEAWDTDTEFLSIKSAMNLVRLNTFLRCLGHLSNRHGAGNVIELNWIEDCLGIAVQDLETLVRLNHVLRCAHKIRAMAGSMEAAQFDGRRKGHPAAERSRFVGNTGDSADVVAGYQHEAAFDVPARDVVVLAQAGAIERKRCEGLQDRRRDPMDEATRRLAEGPDGRPRRLTAAEVGPNSGTDAAPIDPTDPGPAEPGPVEPGPTPDPTLADRLAEVAGELHVLDQEHARLGAGLGSARERLDALGLEIRGGVTPPPPPADPGEPTPPTSPTPTPPPTPSGSGFDVPSGPGPNSGAAWHVGVHYFDHESCLAHARRYGVAPDVCNVFQGDRVSGTWEQIGAGVFDRLASFRGKPIRLMYSWQGIPNQEHAYDKGPGVFEAIRKGQRDEHLGRFAKGLRAYLKGSGHERTAILRPWWEGSAKDYPSSLLKASPDLYKAAFGRMAGIVLNENPDIGVSWCPLWRGHQDGNILSWMPEECHILGCDYYPQERVETRADWERYLNLRHNGGPQGLGPWLEECKRLNRPLMVCEWGPNPTKTGDAPEIARGIHRFFAEHANDKLANGKPAVVGEMYHTLGTNDLSRVPRTAAAYAELYGRGKG